MQVVDPHIHLWDLKTHHYPWLANPGKSFVGDARELKHDYLIGDLLRDAAPVQVLKLVHVDANHDPTDPVEETRWLQHVADNEGRGLPNALGCRAELGGQLLSHRALQAYEPVKSQLRGQTKNCSAARSRGPNPLPTGPQP